MWGATARVVEALTEEYNFNPRTPCGVRPDMPAVQSADNVISIHAPRVGCDRVEVIIVDTLSISIHAPRVGCDSASGV